MESASSILFRPLAASQLAVFPPRSRLSFEGATYEAPRICRTGGFGHRRAAFAPGVAIASHADVAGLKIRKVGKVEIAYKSPHAKPNGLQATREGLWVQDQGPENWVSLVNWADGKVIREFKPDIQAASGVTVDDNNVMWLSSTYSCMHVACSPQDGKTIAKYWTPGAGRIYQMAGDPPASRTTLKPAYPEDEGAAAPTAARGGAARGTAAAAPAAGGNAGPGWTGAAGLCTDRFRSMRRTDLAGPGPMVSSTAGGSCTPRFLRRGRCMS